jgi:hypothetical protein
VMILVRSSPATKILLSAVSPSAAAVTQTDWWLSCPS